MISTIGMVHQLHFYVKNKTFFTQTFLDKDLFPPPDKCPNFFLKKVLVGQCPKFGSFFNPSLRQKVEFLVGGGVELILIIVS